MRNIILLLLLCAGCARIIPPTGGPKDLDKPQLINTVPPNQSLNFTGAEILLEFDEYIKEENIKSQLMITPRIEGDYKYRVNRNKITLTFDHPFDSSTTYTLNFRNAIKDITEGNVPDNLQFVFSTGSFLDSISISGTVRSLMTKKLLEDITISLYQHDDSITIFNGPPLYSTKTVKDGSFRLQNIKNGQYLVYALNDKNQNLKLESRTEGYGFLESSVSLNDSLTDIQFLVQNLDTRPLVLQNSRPVSQNFDIKFNKYLAEYKLMTTEPPLASNLVEDNQTIRIYFNDQITDSLALRLVAQDSLFQKIDTTVYVKFQESLRKPDKLTTSLDLTNGPVTRQFIATLKLNKPIASVNPDSIYFLFDSVTMVPISEHHYKENYSKDILHFTFNLDSLNRPDSIVGPGDKPFTLILAKGSIITVEQDSIAKIERKLTLKKREEHGLIKGSISTTFASFTIELLDNKLAPLETLTFRDIEGTASYQFTYIKPGDYSIRVMLDENENNRWDAGNILENILPEKTILFFHPNVGTSVITVRANWEQTGIDLNF